MWFYDVEENRWEFLQGTMRNVFGRYVDIGEAIVNIQKGLELLRGSERAIVLSGLAQLYAFAGFYEIADSMVVEVLKLDRDSVNYFRNLADIDFQTWDHDDAIENRQKVISQDGSNAIHFLYLGWHCMYLNQFESALKYVRRWMEDVQHTTYFSYNMMHRVGYILSQNGCEEEANEFFNKQADYCIRLNELNQVRSYEGWTYYDLAGVYAYRGDKAKAYENLRIMVEIGSTSWYGMARLIEIDPLFFSIRDEPEFIQIVSDVLTKILAEHKRVRLLLEENEML